MAAGRPVTEDVMLERCTQALKMLDVNNDDRLTLEDYYLARDSDNVPYAKALKDFFAYLGIKENTDVLTIKESVEKARNSVGDQEFVTKTKALLFAMFDDLDVEGNGFLTPKEWQDFMTALEFDDVTKCEEIFKSMDLNKDCQMSREEFVEMSFDYWFTGKNKFSSDKMFGKQ
jgi:Ca2+-binding EF-hand superfamily protein